jgi:membrane protease YdiL (CAAX protease family)
MKQSRAVFELLLFFVAFFLPGYIAQASGGPVGAAGTSLLLQSVVTGLPQFLLMAYVAGVTGPASSPRWGFVPLGRHDILRVAFLVAACFLVIAPIGAVTMLLPLRWSSLLVSGYRWGLQSFWQIPVALLFGLTAGYREEFFFRSYLLGRLEEMSVPLPYAIAMSVALFCLGHLYEGALGLVVAAALGTMLSLAYVRTRNIHVVAIAHGLYNTLALSLSLVLPRALPGAVGFGIFH